VKRLFVASALSGCEKPHDPPPAASPPVEKTAPNLCAAKVAIEADKIAFDSGTGIRGTTTPDALDFSPLKAAGPCAATIIASDATGYQLVVSAMDGLTRIGITAIALDDGTPARKPTPARAASGGTSATMPMLSLSRDAVFLAGVLIGKVDDPGLAAVVQKALPAHPKDPTVIIQADRSLAYGAIKHAIVGATAAGYANVLFATQR